MNETLLLSLLTLRRAFLCYVILPMRIRGAHPLYVTPPRAFWAAQGKQVSGARTPRNWILTARQMQKKPGRYRPGPYSALLSLAALPLHLLINDKDVVLHLADAVGAIAVLDAVREVSLGLVHP